MEAGTVSKDQAWAMIEGAMDALTRALLGLDPDVGHLPAWNAPGAIDAHLRRVLNLPDGPPEDAVKTALAKLLHVSRQVRTDTGKGSKDAETGSAVLIHFIGLTAAHLLGESPPPA
ncbi:hypothetical protein KTR66_03705 [Roseococcus sp. SDR]|uniref:hypothetical protein n=1 Tax=Roseococcus sp. SDR TaxID=2835532 RepID=UPI001BCE98F5|nr:hypothetical protein [Roseococcus sp. SDR]MBS7789085.1 hypothetical protein [Roseococcus sp. SDR]MBV1844399.1 hypothetical protein [Roseococcus sp. SDR]